MTLFLRHRQQPFLHPRCAATLISAAHFTFLAFPDFSASPGQHACACVIHDQGRALKQDRELGWLSCPLGASKIFMTSTSKICVLSVTSEARSLSDTISNILIVKVSENFILLQNIRL